MNKNNFYYRLVQALNLILNIDFTVRWWQQDGMFYVQVPGSRLSTAGLAYPTYNSTANISKQCLYL
jgi:hypothetical protein